MTSFIIEPSRSCQNRQWTTLASFAFKINITPIFYTTFYAIVKKLWKFFDFNDSYRWFSGPFRYSRWCWKYVSSLLSKTHKIKRGQISQYLVSSLTIDINALTIPNFAKLKQFFKLIDPESKNCEKRRFWIKYFNTILSNREIFWFLTNLHMDYVMDNLHKFQKLCSSF